MKVVMSGLVCFAMLVGGSLVAPNYVSASRGCSGNTSSCNGEREFGTPVRDVSKKLVSVLVNKPVRTAVKNVRSNSCDGVSKGCSGN